MTVNPDYGQGQSDLPGEPYIARCGCSRECRSCDEANQQFHDWLDEERVWYDIESFFADLNDKCAEPYPSDTERPA